MPDRDPLNFFSPYERLPAGHENQLTRALLLLLRMSPMAHVEWLRLAAAKRFLWALPPAEFDTQRRAVRTDGNDDGTEQAELISVFLAPEQPQSGGGDVVESDRRQVLDAIIDYGELVTVVENKVFEADDLQARQINLDGAGVQLVGDREVVVVVWRDLLEALTGIARPENRPEFDRHFTATARKTATPRPGLMLARLWPLAEAERLDSRGKFTPAVKEALQTALRTVGEPEL